MPKKENNLWHLLEEKIRPTPDPEVNVNTIYFKKNIKVEIVKVEDKDMEFDVIGIHPELINALRRILISEIPTIAIEQVNFNANTTGIQDELLAHRLGLIPLKANPKLFQFRVEGQEISDRDTLNYELKVKCAKNPNCKYGDRRQEDMYVNYQVLSSFIKWIPMGDQKNFCNESEMAAVNDDIMVAKLRPGREIDAQMVAVKGIGRDHAKFSPVGTASYRLLPYISLLEEIKDEKAEKLQTCFTVGVIGIQEGNGSKKAYVKDARADFCSRNVFMYDDLKDSVLLGRVKDHYIFTIESVVAEAPDDLFRQSIKVLKDKSIEASEILQEIIRRNKSKQV